MLSPTKHKKRGAYDALSLLSLLKSTHFHVHKCHLRMRILRLECREACPRRVFYTAWMSYEFLAHRKNPTHYRSLRLSDSYISAWRYASCFRIAKKGTSAPPYPARGAGSVKLQNDFLFRFRQVCARFHQNSNRFGWFVDSVDTLSLGREVLRVYHPTPNRDTGQGSESRWQWISNIVSKTTRPLPSCFRDFVSVERGVHSGDLSLRCVQSARSRWT